MQHPASELDNSAEDNFMAKDFLLEVWRRKRIVVHTILVTILFSCLWLWIAPAQYTATAIVGPAQQNTPSSTASALSAVLPLAGLSGPLSGSGAATAPFDQFMQLITSPRVAALMIKEDPTILQTIFPGEWDKTTKTWHPSSSPLQIGKRALSVVFGQPSWQPPSPSRLSDYLQSHLQITPVNTTTSMQTIAFSFQSSQFAGKFLKRLLDDADASLREEAMDRTDKQIAYLQSKLLTTQPVDYRAALVALIATQETTRMTINKGLPFAAMRIQQPVVSDLPTTPSPIVTLLIGAFLGIFIGLFLTLVLTVWAPNFMPKPIWAQARDLWGKIANHHPLSTTKASSHYRS